MPRVEIGTPNQFLFNMERTVGISDLNYAKHLDSVAMLQILNEARLQLLAHLGLPDRTVLVGLHKDRPAAMHDVLQHELFECIS